MLYGEQLFLFISSHDTLIQDTLDAFWFCSMKEENWVMGKTGGLRRLEQARASASGFYFLYLAMYIDC